MRCLPVLSSQQVTQFQTFGADAGADEDEGSDVLMACWNEYFGRGDGQILLGRRGMDRGCGAAVPTMNDFLLRHELAHRYHKAGGEHVHSEDIAAWHDRAIRLQTSTPRYWAAGTEPRISSTVHC